MLKRNFKPKRNTLYLLMMALVAVVMLMLLINKSTHRNTPNPFSQTFQPGTGDTINVAIEMNPSVYRVKGDTITGRDYEVMQRISEKYSVPIKYYPFVPLQKAMEGLDNGTFDVVVASLPLITSLKDKYLMTDPVYLDREILVQRDDSTHKPIKSQVELGGDTVWITQDSPFRTRLENLSAEIGDTIHIQSSPEYSAEALFILTATGHIKYAVINEGIARELLPNFDNVDISTPISFTQFQSWALNKNDSTLLDSLNNWLKEVAPIENIQRK